MDQKTSPIAKHIEALPLSGALVPTLAFLGLTVLAKPHWPGIDSSNTDTLLLSISMFVPLFVLCARPAASKKRQWLGLILASLCSIFVLLHSGLSNIVVRDFDEGTFPSKQTIEAVSGLFISTLAIPAGLLAILTSKFNKSLLIWMVVPALAAALGQLAWFGLVRLIQGPTGLEFWLWTRVLIHVGTGIIAGLLAGGAKVFAPDTKIVGPTGITQTYLNTLPSALFLAIVLTVCFAVPGIIRIHVEKSDPTRFINCRLDEYFLCLSNLRRAQNDNLLYPELEESLTKSKQALLKSASFDHKLPGLLETMLQSLQSTQKDRQSFSRFRTSVLTLDKYFIKAGIPFFLEPQQIKSNNKNFRFLIRYKVTQTNTYTNGRTSAPMVKLRRIDNLAMDTPYNGLSYPGLGTILMDHVDNSALKLYAPIFAKNATTPKLTDGKLAKTKAMMRVHQKTALEKLLLSRKGQNALVLRRIAGVSQKWISRFNSQGVRKQMDPPTISAYNNLCELIGEHTAIHEARHAIDGDYSRSIAPLNELVSGGVNKAAVPEIRSYLTEIIDGPLGPKFGLAGVMDLVISDDARANAYFFSGVVILEGLWQERIRRPDTIELEGPTGTIEKQAPFSAKHPGWLSYAKINTCCDELFALPQKIIKKRAKDLFEKLFRETYKPITKQTN